MTESTNVNKRVKEKRSLEEREKKSKMKTKQRWKQKK